VVCEKELLLQCLNVVGSATTNNAEAITEGSLSASVGRPFAGAAQSRATEKNWPVKLEQKKSRAVARKPHDITAVLLSLKFANTIHYKFKSS